MTGSWAKRSIGLAAVLPAIVAAIAPAPADAYWSATDTSGTSPAQAVGDSLPQGAMPGPPTTNAPNGTTVTLSFSPATTAGGAAVATYRLTRHPAAGGSAVVANVSCSIAGNVTCTESAAPEGMWQYTDAPRLGDNWVGAESAKSAMVTVDPTPPTVTIGSPTNGDSYNNTRWGGASGAFSGTATDATSGIPGATSIRLTITQASTGRTWNGSAFATGANTVPATTYDSATGKWTYAFPAASFPADGTYTVSAQATDTATNTAGSATTAFKINNNLVVTINAPVNAAVYNAASWPGAISGSTSDANSTVTTVKVSVQRGSDPSGCWTGVLNTFTATCPNFVAAIGTSSWAEPFTTANFNGDGGYTVKAQVTDLAGNVETVTAAFVYDTLAPAPTIGAPAPGGFVSSTTPTISGNAGTQAADGSHSADASTVTVKLFSGSGTGGTLRQTLTANVSGSGTWSVTPAALPANAQYTAQVLQTDGAGNSGNATSTFVIDTTSPAVTLTAPANGSALTMPTPTYSGAAGAIAASTTSSADSATVTVKVYGGSSATGTPVQTLTATRSGSSWSVTAAAALPAGQYTAQASQTDGAGNTATSAANTFTIALGPTVAITFPPNGSFYDGSGSGWNATHGSCPAKTICGTAAPSFGTVSTVAVQIQDATTGSCWNGRSNTNATFTSTCTTSANVTGGFFTATNTGSSFSTWSIATADAGHLADGHLYLIVARATDGAGTQSTTSTFGYDNTAPAITGVHVVNADTGGLDEVQPGHGFYVIATVMDATSGVGSVTANISGLDGVGSDTAVRLNACAGCTVRGTTYNYVSATFTAGSSTGNKNITVTAADNASAANSVTTPNVPIAVDSTRPTVKSVTIANKAGGVAGKPEPGDTIAVTYSSLLSVPSVCSSWPSADSVSGTITSNASVAITKQTTDTVSVASSDCTLHFGSIDLGATAYAAGTVGQVLTFGGSTVAWDGTSKITITLGNAIGGTATQGTKSTNSTATYTPDPQISDVAGNLISGTGTTGSKVQF